MIVNISFLVFFLILLPFLIIFLLSIFSKIKFPHHQFRRKEKIYFCRTCEAVYSVRNERPLNGCPSCGNLNSSIEEII